MIQDCYQIITDEQALREFISWLPNHESHEQYYLALFARKKYAGGDPAVLGDKLQLKRIVTTKDRMFNKIKQLECPMGSFRGSEDLPIPQEALALYISPNPRCLYRSTIKGIQALAGLLEKGKEQPNPRQEILSVIQNTKSRTCYHIFDVDSKDDSVYKKVLEISQNRADIIETRGGYHVLIHNKYANVLEKNWYVEMKKISDVTGDTLCPMIGTYQGGFTPHWK